MNAYKRNAVIAGAVLRLKCKEWDKSKLDEALQASIKAHNVEVTEYGYFNLREDIERVYETKEWPKAVKQIEWSLWGKSPRQDDQLSGARG